MTPFFKLQYNKGHKSHFSLWNLHKDESWSKIKRPLCLRVCVKGRQNKEAGSDWVAVLPWRSLFRHGGENCTFWTSILKGGVLDSPIKLMSMVYFWTAWNQREPWIFSKGGWSCCSPSRKDEEKTKLEAEAAPDIDSLVFFFKVHLTFKVRRFWASCSLRRFWRQCTWNLEDRCSPF